MRGSNNPQNQQISDRYEIYNIHSTDHEQRSQQKLSRKGKDKAAAVAVFGTEEHKTGNKSMR